MELFRQLRTVKVGTCHELTNIFSFISDRVFQDLEEIDVLECENMKKIFAISEQVHEIKLSKLRILRLKSLPQLESLCCNVKTTTPILQLTSDTGPGEIIREEEQGVPKPLFNEKVVLTNLETLEIDNINVKIIWDNQLPIISSIQNLTCLILSNLVNLRRLDFGEDIKFPSLKEMTIQGCSKFKEVLFDAKVKVPSLEKINISRMENLKMIWCNQLGQDSFPKLKSLQVEGCQMLLTLFGLNMCQTFLSLETLDVSKCGSLEEILDLKGINSEESQPTTSNQYGELYPTSVSFDNLQNLKVSGCGSLKSLFSVSNVTKRVEVKEEHAITRFDFPKLAFLELYKLPKLRNFYPSRYIMEWPILKLLMMEQCGVDDTNEKSLIQQSTLLSIPNQVVLAFHQVGILPSLLLTMSSWVQNLTMLIVRSCDNLEELFSYSLIVTDELKEKKIRNTMVFPKLTYLEIGQLTNLKGLCSGRHIEFPTLKEFTISNCLELPAFIFNDKIGVPSLEKINISSMDNLEMIWHNQLDHDSTPKLKSLQVQGCQKLLTLFRSNVYGRFLRLETVEISDCGSLEEIFDLRERNSEERHSTTSTQSKELCTTVLSFENLQILKVSNCGSLKSLFSISNVAKDRGAVGEAYATVKFVFPKLTSLKLHKLPKLVTTRYTVEWPSLRRLQLWDCGIPETDDEERMQHPLFLVEKVFPYLEELTLAGRELMMMWQGQDPECVFRNFKNLEIIDESKADEFCGEDKPVLYYIGDVKYMWKQNFILDLILPNFGNIVVDGCDSFISLMLPSASFQSLTSLQVWNCDILEHTGTFFMAKNLVKLVHLKICYCKKIVEVVGNHGDATGDKILFSNLKSLSLQSLPSLTSFCSWNFTLEFPSLEELYVSGCPNMTTFSQEILTTPKLWNVELDYESVQLSPAFDVNTAIKQLHEQKQVARSSTKD